VVEADLYRELAGAHDDIAMWRNLVAIMPWTVHVDHEAVRSQERAARLLARIPTQRMPIDLRPLARPVRNGWGARR
jgi:hypothetical protein